MDNNPGKRSWSNAFEENTDGSKESSPDMQNHSTSFVAMEDEVWGENLYKNWVRGAKGLEFLQEGLKEFVGDKALVRRDEQLRIITNVPIGPLFQCIQCTSENLLPEHSNLQRACNRCIHRNASNCFGSRPRRRRKCPNGICSKLYDAIVNDHCYNDPVWKNLNPGTWSSDPHGWSYMKCFETTKGPGTSAQTTDASGLLSILINNRSIQNWLACHNIGSNAACPFFKARYIRNEILHKSKLELEDHTLDEYIDTFITVLEDPKCLLTYAGSQDAVQKLQKLKSKQINISQMDEKNIRKIRKEAYLKMKTELQDDLIEFYRQKHATIILSPLINEKCTPFLAFHVMPNIQIINVKRAPGGGKEERTLVTPFRNVFYKGNNVLREIYLTADAGQGKTAFCKRLALTWCQAKKHIDENEYFLEEEKEALAGFDFMFLLMLRDSSGECDIDDMILSQIVPELSNTYTSNDLKKMMSKASCLVILDGLDEWTHPSTSCKRRHGQIPHRKARKWTIMTTTRPWKLSLSGLSSSQIDQRLEITGLGPESANKLKRSVIAHLYGDEDENKIEQYMKDFNKAVQVKHISDFETVPLLLMYLLFLWHDKVELGESLCELYSNIIQLLLSRTVQKLEEKDLPPMSENTQDCIPKCLSENELCGQFYKILTDLGNLAFHTLFKETRENTIVFDSSIAKQYLNEQYLKFCLKTGMITESKIQGKLLKQESKVSFSHKTVQEFFAALYIRSTPDQTSVPETVLSKCTCVKDILEMSKILIFLSGFNVNVSSLISRELMKVINEDEITREHRSNLGYSRPLKQFQDMCISCCKELQHDTEVSFCLQDVFITKSCEQEQYRENLKQLTSRNKQNIRSLFIDIGGNQHLSAPYSSAQEVIEYFALSDLENIEKIYYNGEYNARDILPLLKRPVQSLSLLHSKSSWSDLLYEKVTSLQNLEAIEISKFKMSHEQLTLLYDYISRRQCMREIQLWYLECSDHGRRSCTGYSLELSKHSQLRKIILCEIPVPELNINMSSLERCDLQCLYNPDLVLRFINCVQADSKVNKFVCNDLKSSAAIETMLQTLPLLVHVERVVLWQINLDNINLCTSDMVNLELVHLNRVTMPASLLRAIVTVLQQLTQTVTVDIWDCNITPESEFVTVKEELKQSSQFRVREDSEDLGRKIFKFETIKDGD